MAIRRFLLFASLFGVFAGCQGPGLENVPVDEGRESDCTWSTEPQTIQSEVDWMHHIQTLEGNTRGGAYEEFPWLDDAALLNAIDITVAWEAGVTGPDRLAFEIVDREHTRTTGERGPHEGPSPIERHLSLNRTHDLGDTVFVRLGMPYQNPLPAAIMVEPVTINITVQQHFTGPC